MVAVAIGGALYGWHRFGSLATQSADYVLTPDRIHVTPQPPWIHADVKVEVVRSAGLSRLDLRDLRAIDLDPAARTVWAEAGLSAVALSTATAAQGLAVGFGDTGSVGIAGITLGGGIGRASCRERVLDHV